jgi:UDP-N-acetylmuramoyl-L-alanyl-D-glutamate--2,6-diaminopimelate ligase
VACDAQDLSELHYDYSCAAPIIAIPDLKTKIDFLARQFYGKPSDGLQITGITGTNGKTTSSYLLAQALSRLEIPCAVLGTLGYGFVPQLSPNALTTPDVVSLHKYFHELKQHNAQAVAMEVSSHALEQGRVSGVEFFSALFTNLTQDHLDYHGNMEAYGRAKQKLFKFSHLKQAVVNADSSFAQKILQVIRRDVPIALYTTEPSGKFSSHLLRSNIFPIYVTQFDLNQKGMNAHVTTPWGEGVLRSHLLGKFNLSNLLGVLGDLCLRGFSLSDALWALSQAFAAPGRMQRIGGASTPQVIIDYAHTPDALENALKAARLHCRRRLWCVFGCGGDRDNQKRAQMGQLAGRLADKVVITSDNPRTENPRKIIDEILQGLHIEHTDKGVVEEDRAGAINYAINHALAVDTILIAGKGHEDYQIIGDKKFPFSDAQCVKALLNEDNHNETISHR